MGTGKGGDMMPDNVPEEMRDLEPVEMRFDEETGCEIVTFDDGSTGQRCQNPDGSITSTHVGLDGEVTEWDEPGMNQGMGGMGGMGGGDMGGMGGGGMGGMGGGGMGGGGMGGGAGGGSLTVQQPVQAVLNVTTTVSVPDGGTVLLGGVKRLKEGRNMAGVPILNKIPYISRLFKNSGVGRDTESVMLMVTPRIIIQEEEEELLGIPPE